jgi:hypothetical protein
MSAPTPADLVGTLPLPTATFRAGRRRQIQRLRAARDEYPHRSPRWHLLNSELVFAERKLAELERPRRAGAGI